MLMVPWLWMPMMSPAKASSAVLRSLRHEGHGVVDRARPCRRRPGCSFMPRSKRPEQTRRKAIRSRCAGSMLAWILNTKPENFGSSGCDACASASRRGSGAGDSSTTRVEQLLHAEVVDRRAEEHRRLLAGQVGVQVEGVRRAAHQFDLARAARPACGRAVRPGAGCRRPSMTSPAVPFSACGSKNADAVVVAGDRRRGKRLPMPIGQVIGAHWMPSTVSISSSSSIGSRPSRSSLLMKVMIGVSRRRQTSSSLIVCASTPLAESMTITAESTAVSVR